MGANRVVVIHVPTVVQFGQIISAAFEPHAMQIFPLLLLLLLIPGNGAENAGHSELDRRGEDDGRRDHPGPQ